MKIHIIQTGTVQIKKAQATGNGHGILRQTHTFFDSDWTDHLPIYAYAIEHPQGIIVIDTGETAQIHEKNYFTWWHPYFRFMVREWVKPEEEIGVQLKKIGISPTDVRWVILTHLHTDHAGGIKDFPNSEIIVSKTEYEQAKGFKGQLKGFLPQHWPKWFNPTLIEFKKDDQKIFPEFFPFTEDILLVKTAGHTAGHMSVILKTDDVNYFFAGDASYTQQNMIKGKIDGVSLDEKEAEKTLQRIKKYCEKSPTIYLPSHEFEGEKRLKNRLAAL